MKIRKYFSLNDNENLIYKNLRNIAKYVFRCKCIALSVLLGRMVEITIDLSVHLK